MSTGHEFIMATPVVGGNRPFGLVARAVLRRIAYARPPLTSPSQGGRGWRLVRLAVTTPLPPRQPRQVFCDGHPLPLDSQGGCCATATPPYPPFTRGGEYWRGIVNPPLVKGG